MRLLLFSIQMLMLGQSDVAKPEFEVAAIKLLQQGLPDQPTGGPGTKDPTTIRCQCYLGTMVNAAFGLKVGEANPSDPIWNWTQLFLLTAKIPAGATKEQLPIMLQAFVKERFHLAYHFEKKELSGYQMVAARNGPKLKESVEDPEGTSPPAVATKMERDGFPNTPGLWPMAWGTKYWAKKQTMSQFATFMGHHAFKPVVDATGLTGTYDIVLYWESTQRDASGTTSGDTPAVSSASSGEPLLGAIQSQLGLKLEPKKVIVNVLVVDHIDKTPTGN